MGRLGVRVNCLAPSMIRTRLTLTVPGLREAPPDGAFDPYSPAVVAPVAAYLASTRCSMTGQVLAVRGGRITVGSGWSHDDIVTKEDALWDVGELADAMATLPHPDVFAALAEALGGALGVTGRAELEPLIEGALDTL